jgi:hypothetical protein
MHSHWLVIFQLTRSYHISNMVSAIQSTSIEVGWTIAIPHWCIPRFQAPWMRQLVYASESRRYRGTIPTFVYWRLWFVVHWLSTHNNTEDLLLADFSYDHTFLQLPGCIYPNTNLLRQGCLSSSPTRVSFAISLRTLELYHRLHVCQPRLSIQAWVRSICDYHNVS